MQWELKPFIDKDTNIRQAAVELRWNEFITSSTDQEERRSYGSQCRRNKKWPQQTGEHLWGSSLVPGSRQVLVADHRPVAQGVMSGKTAWKTGSGPIPGGYLKRPAFCYLRIWQQM